MKKAVALKYPANSQAPFITAKGQGALAERLLEIAEENDIPVVEDELTANVLSISQIGDCIPESTWESVARIFAFIGELDEQNRKK